MAHYEVQKFAEDRWVIDAVFRDRTTAIDDARLRAWRSPRHAAVRVVKVEEPAAGSGFVERIIYTRSAKGPHGNRKASVRGLAWESWTLPRRLDGGMESGSAAPALPMARHFSATVLMAAALLGSVLILGVGIHSRARDPWVFDRPEAQQPNPVQNPWSGQISH